MRGKSAQWKRIASVLKYLCLAERDGEQPLVLLWTLGGVTSTPYSTPTCSCHEATGQVHHQSPFALGTKILGLRVCLSVYISHNIQRLLTRTIWSLILRS